jgi:predicted kinase
MYGAQTFSRALLADQSGRTSDAKEVNYTACIAWMDKFMKIVDHYNDDWLNRPDLRVENQTPFYMPIAPSGAGKSTYLTKLKQQHPDLVVFSLDALRHEFYDPVDYAKAYQGSVDDKSFEARANARFFAMVKEHKPMYIDNTNLSAKRRKFYLQTAKKHAYQTTAVLMPVALNVLLERQHSRKDKTVPEAAVKQQYKSLQTPLKGEFNNIVFSDHNLKRPGA